MTHANANTGGSLRNHKIRARNGKAITLAEVRKPLGENKPTGSNKTETTKTHLDKGLFPRALGVRDTVCRLSQERSPRRLRSTPRRNVLTQTFVRDSLWQPIQQHAAAPHRVKKTQCLP